MKSKMFLNNVTAIDLAYIDDTGAVIGDSINPKIIVTGDVDPTEKVVVDFSSIKKDIKGIIDAKYSGFDHKLWLVEGYSKYSLSDNPMTPPGVTYVLTPKMSIAAPRDAFKLVKARSEVPQTFIDIAMNCMVFELEDELRIKYPNINLRIELGFDDDFISSPDMDTELHPFRYVHGLKDSTSWGCQNIAHGHLSFLAATANPDANLREVEMCLQSIAAELDGKVFVNNANIFAKHRDFTVIGYTTPRGEFAMSMTSEYVEESALFLDTETTVEYLALFVATKYKDKLEKARVEKLYVSEGLNKGAVIYLEDI